MWRTVSCKLDKVKGVEGNRQPIGRCRQGQMGGETVAGHCEGRHCAWSEELSPGVRLEPGACPHFLFL